MKILKNRVVSNIVALLFLQGTNYLLPLITFPYLVRVLGTEHYGLLIMSSAFMQYLVIFTDYGFNMTATRRIALLRNNQQEVSKIFTSVISIKLLLVTIAFLLMCIVVFLVPSFSAEWKIYLVSFLTVIGSVLFPIWFFQGIEKMKYITFLNIGSKLLVTLLIFLFVNNKEDYLPAAFLQSLTTFIPGLIGFYIVCHKYSIKFNFSLDRKLIKEELKEGWSVFLASISGNVYGQGAVIITGLIAGSKAAGYYGMAQKITSAIIGISQPVAQGIYPYLCTLYENNMIKFYRLKKLINIFGLGIGVLLSLLLFIFSRPIILLVSGQNQIEGTILLRFFSIILLVTIINVLLNPFILSLGKFIELQKLYGKTALIFLMLSIPLTFLFKFYGMAATIIIVESFISYNSIRITREVG